MSDHVDEFMHALNFQASKQTEQIKPAYYGYIKEYDIERGMVRVIDPLNGPETDDNNPGPAMVSDWMPFGTLQAGITGDNPINSDIKNWGLQIVPFGGGDERTFDQPTEQVLVINIRTSTGYSSCALMLYNSKAMPPGKEIPILGDPADKGDLLYVNASGTTLLFDTDKGNLDLYVQKPEGGSGGAAKPQSGDSAQPTDGSSSNSAGQGHLLVGVAGGVHLQTFGDFTDPPDDPDEGDIDIVANKNLQGVAAGGIVLQTVENTDDQNYEIDDVESGDIDVIALENAAIVATNGGINIQTGVTAAGKAAALDGEIQINADTNIIGDATDAVIFNSDTFTVNADTLITMLATGITMTVSGAVLIDAPSVQIGAGIRQFLATQTLVEAFLDHVHPTPSGTSGPPITDVTLSPPFLTAVTEAS